ncbi:MAG: hypothetical protein A2268_10635 [Candidatus Raymondbacteria bacterium RifOxyA12_full_50_37]|uniref:Uncharacterized protein n=1 Tax=Candidatus Raymondbacteria bacterium RIFOXYD12_FULL_49_13 TaxID=1817890 RepID=A0A1F7F952_UNCRA|nr:MAG: hypothetical protein A2268_10635 [Candidatus Raymondbacteria bacterium RifOxyA12_full_50_37]OGJ85421.1 MAG: hypothetical protein A2248_12420 [Candidatus Raymondbacteria bacterium RIFOXYA2_FULL_49_16]OGJ94929.1 MAG: hypothetical protein A2453_07890 [Candidatus Raymondbacteria bacterium RIFOXYC2_FULL_50_21]OGJ98687.1 MAG: hypothetical protein A2487_05740 [Candidatus Raymondbacteria bacterium RifOxyC12_full_50_8]OGK03046.1 MAG: hypothetical protein A2519_21375 [Candidatus Raymondbacteria b
MVWEKTDCYSCAQLAGCPDKTRFYLNYCGSQRAAMKDKLFQAREECLARRGVHYMRIRINYSQSNRDMLVPA